MIKAASLCWTVTINPPGSIPAVCALVRIIRAASRADLEHSDCATGCQWTIRPDRSEHFVCVADLGHHDYGDIPVGLKTVAAACAQRRIRGRNDDHIASKSPVWLR